MRVETRRSVLEQQGIRVPASSGQNRKGATPDFQVHMALSGVMAGKFHNAPLREVGAGWNRKSKDGGKTYVSVKLDSPLLPAPLNCALFTRDDGTYVLVWDREKPAEA